MKFFFYSFLALVFSFLTLSAFSYPASFSIHKAELYEGQYTHTVSDDKLRLLYPDKYFSKKLPKGYFDLYGMSTSINHVLGVEKANVYDYDRNAPHDERYFFEKGRVFFMLALTPKNFSYTKKAVQLDKANEYWARMNAITVFSDAYERRRLMKKELGYDVMVPAIDNRKWQYGNLYICDDEFRFEFIPKRQRIEAFKERYTIEFFNSKFAKNLDEYLLKYKKFNSIFAEDLDLQYYEKISKISDNSVYYEWGFGDGYENVISTITYTPEGFYRVAYTKMSPLSDEDRTKWAQITKKEVERQAAPEKKAH